MDWSVILDNKQLVAAVVLIAAGTFIIIMGGLIGEEFSEKGELRGKAFKFGFRFFGGLFTLGGLIELIRYLY